MYSNLQVHVEDFNVVKFHFVVSDSNAADVFFEMGGESKREFEYFYTP